MMIVVELVKKLQDNFLKSMWLCIICKTKDVNVDVILKNETIWMTQKGISELFECSTDNIGFHLKNIYLDEGLVKEATTEHFSVVRDEGNRQVRRTLEFYNLDVIIIVEYRVNSKKKIFILLIIKKLLEYRYRKTVI